MSWSGVLRRSNSAATSKPADLSLCVRRRGLDIVDLRTYCEDLKLDMEEHEDRSISCWMPGPSETPFADRKFRIRFELPDRYPLCSPSVGFLTKIWHPNIDFASGTVCLDLLNQRWTPILTLRHIIEFLLPELLRDPNPDSPLNLEAAYQLQSSTETFKTAVLAKLAEHDVPLVAAVVAAAPATDRPEGLKPEPTTAGETATAAPVVEEEAAVAAPVKPEGPAKVSRRKRARKDDDDD